MLADPTSMTVKHCVYCKAPEAVDALIGLARIAVMYHKRHDCEMPDNCGHCLAMIPVNQVISDAAGCRTLILKMAEEKADQLLAGQEKGYESSEAKRVHAGVQKQVKSIEFWLDQLRRKSGRRN